MARPDRAPRLTGDGGAVLAEFALMLPFLALLALGVVEYGMAYQEGNQLERTVAYAGRTGGTAGRTPFSDYDILQAIDAGILGQDRITLRRVIVYEATDEDGAPPVSCTNINPTGVGVFGVDGVCNVYSPQQVATKNPGVGFRRSLPNPPSLPYGDCLSGSWDSSWCFSTRGVSQNSRERVGVQVDVDYEPLTSLIPGTTFQITRRAVFELEPEVAT